MLNSSLKEEGAFFPANDVPRVAIHSLGVGDC